MRFANHPQRRVEEYGNRILNYLANHNLSASYCKSTERQTVEFENLRHTDVFEITQPGGVLRLGIPRTIARVKIDFPYEGMGHVDVYADRKLIPEEKLKTIVESVRANGF